MRNLHDLDRLRYVSPWVVSFFGSVGDEGCGAFRVASPIDQKPLFVIATTEAGWDHVSVSRRHRCPNWPEMSAVKRLFFLDDEEAMELHVPARDHVNYHPFTLHLWRPNDGREIPRPPASLVGPPTCEVPA